MWLRAPVVPDAKLRSEFANKISGETHQSCQGLFLEAGYFLSQEKGQHCPAEVKPAWLLDNVATLCQAVREGNSGRKEVTMREDRVRRNTPQIGI